MKVTVLGSAAGVPTPERGLPAILVEVEGELVLFDCGEGTQRQMMKAGYGLCRRMRIFVTHLHGDHIFGLPGMIQTMNLLNRIHPLEVYGPPGLKEFIEETTVATMSEPVFDLSVYEVSEGEVFRGRRYRIEGAWGDHSRATMAYRMVVGGSPGRFRPRRARALGVPEGPLWSELKSGRRITLRDGRVVEPKDVLGEPVPGKILVYSGDTRFSPNIVRLATGADILIHEGTLASGLKDWAEMEGHSTTEVAARVAKEAKVKRLILTHISARYPDARVLEDEARKIFPRTEVAQDLKVYELKS
ncbi:MAG: ribonuclease Z [Candidatus Verstraetearchaeota archaeon]|nr:ribonuclease Z [Candidatus Verstraetearchaeota archaeon]